MRSRDRIDAFLWGQALLTCLLGAALALFLSYPSLRSVWELPQLKLVLATLFALAGLLIGLLTATRFAIDGRRFDLVLCAGSLVTAGSWLAFSVAPAIAETQGHRTESWAAVVGRIAGWMLIAAAPFARVRVRRASPEAALAIAGSACVVVLALAWGASRALGSTLPDLDTGGAAPPPVMGALAAQGLVHLLAVIGFSDRYRTRGEDLDRWLALGSTLMLFASLHYVFTPLVRAGDVSQGDFLQLLAYCVLLVGVWRAIRESEFGRAVAEERARLAREIHDGLAQYLFAISANVSLLEGGADTDETLARLRDAATAAQQEARYAILALSSASGRSPFATALRRYVDVLTADGALAVELAIDESVRLSADEQIEVFRIVQEGLANARKHAGAGRALVEVAGRGRRRVVSIRDDGHGFAPGAATEGLGLRSMRQRAASIGGAFSLESSPRGTALEVVLRT
ncbi:MAG TPA: histidine kinase [Gaiellaceae bacterium]|jgi:signal transduction histidine kinase